MGPSISASIEKAAAAAEIRFCYLRAIKTVNGVDGGYFGK